jgi:hypothetical protein
MTLNFMLSPGRCGACTSLFLHGRFFVRLSISLYSLRTAVNRVLRSIAHRGGFQQPARNLGLWLIAACRRTPAAAARPLRCTQNLPPRQCVLRSQSKKQHVNETFSINVHLHCRCLETKPMVRETISTGIGSYK